MRNHQDHSDERYDMLWDRCVDNLNKEKNSERILSVFSFLWVTFLFPLAVGFAPSLVSILENKLIAGAAITTALVHVFFSIVNLRGQSKSAALLAADVLSVESKLLKERNDLRKEHADLLRNHDRLAERGSAVITTTFFLSNHTHISLAKLNNCTSKKEVSQLLKRSIQNFVNIVSMEREQLFGYSSESLYNIAVYVQGGDKRLHVYGRDCDTRIGRRNRSWGIGEGHVGLTFLHGSEKCSPDISQSSEMSDGSYDESDIKHYKSFFSVPIVNFNNSETPFGVLVVTSALCNQFNRDRDGEFLLTSASLLGILISTAKAKIRSLNQ